MKLPEFVLFVIIITITCPLRVYAATFTDDMTFPQNTSETQYSGLKPYAGSTHGLSDQTLFTFSDTSSPQAHALYRVNSATTITVGVYSVYGTCVSQNEAGLLLSLGAKQALWSKSKDSIYTDFGGGFRRVELDYESRYDPVFSPVPALPADVIGFGLNIYSTPGNGRPLPLSVTKSVSEPLCYEEYTAAIPAGTQYIKVEINDITSYPVKGGGVIPNRIYNSLASVRINGESLIMGEPAKVERQQPAQPQVPDDEEEEEVTETLGAAFAEDVVDDIPEPEDNSADSSKNASSSKFEGTITSSNTEKSQAPKSNAQIQPAEPESERAESLSSKDEAPRETVYEIRRDSGSNGMSTGVTAYIIIVSGVLVAMLIFWKKR